MITVSQAKNIIERHAPAPIVANRKIEDAQGLWLAEDVRATGPLPSFDSSAMDGYAVALPNQRSETGTNRLKVVGDSQAGTPFTGQLRAGEAVTISTGAVVPEGADRVIPVEHTETQGDRVHLRDLGKVADNIRFEGEEVAVGDRIAGREDQVTPPLLGRLASLGVERVAVFEPPTVAVITTGSELVGVGADLQPGQIRDSNRYVLTALLKATGATVGSVQSVADRWEDTVRAIDRAAKMADIILVTGGVSVGPHDFVKEAAAEVGFDRKFWKVKQKPGKPLFFATRGNTLLFGLPGNPLSVVMNTLYYVQPVIRRCIGHSYPGGKHTVGRVTEPYTRLKLGRAEFLLVRLDAMKEPEAMVHVVRKQRSHMLAGLHAADGFVLVPSDCDRIMPSDHLDVRLFSWGEIQRLGRRAFDGQAS